MMHETIAIDGALMALADPTRRSIVERLAREGEARVTDVARPFPMSLNAVSKHIRVLERSGLIRRRRAGKEHLLSVRPGALDEAARWIERQRALWRTSLDHLESLLEEDDQQKGITR